MSADQLAKLTQALSIEGFQPSETKNSSATVATTITNKNKTPAGATATKTTTKAKTNARRVKTPNMMPPVLQRLKEAYDKIKQNEADKKEESNIVEILGEIIDVVTPTTSAPFCDAIAKVEWSGSLFVDLLSHGKDSSILIKEKTAELLGYLSTHEKCSFSLAKANISAVATPIFLAHTTKMKEEASLPNNTLTRELLEALVNIVILPENVVFLTQSQPLFLHSLVSMVDTSLSISLSLKSLPEGFARQHHSMTYALHCLSNFSNCETSCELVVKAHAIPVLMSVVEKGPFHCKPIALSCLMNLCVGQREAVTQAGALVSVLSILKDASLVSSDPSASIISTISETPSSASPETSSNSKKSKKKEKKVEPLPTNLGVEPETIEAALKLFCNLVEEHSQNAALARSMGTIPLLSGWAKKGAKLKGDQPVTKDIKELASKVVSYVEEGGSNQGGESDKMTTKCLSACFQCGKAEVIGRLMLCARCGIAKYCSRDCQVSHWKSHKASCVKKPTLED